MKFKFARIATDDTQGLAQFYRALTGLAPSGHDAYVEFHGPEFALAIVSQETMERHGARATTPGANRSVILDFEVDDVDRERARLDHLIKRFVLEPTDQPWGNRSMLFRDPDGNLINFFASLRAPQ